MLYQILTRGHGPLRMDPLKLSTHIHFISMSCFNVEYEQATIEIGPYRRSTINLPIYVNFHRRRLLFCGVGSMGP